MAQRSGCATLMLLVGGFILLVPGACALFALNNWVTREYGEYGPLLAWGALAIAALLGIFLIYDFSRNRGDSGS